MLEFILKILLPLLFVDIFYIFYTFFCKLLLKRYKITEKNLRENGVEVEEITLEKVRNNKILILYIICTIIGIVSSFYYEILKGATILESLKNEFMFIWLFFLMCMSIYTVIKRIIYMVSYTKGFMSEFNMSNDDDNEE